MGQMRQCLDTLVLLDAAHRLHRAKAIQRQSEADLMSRSLRDARDFMLALEPHKDALRQLLGGTPE